MQVLTEVDSAVQEKRKDIKEVIIMENRMVKFYSKESNMLALHAIPGHFATSHSHINYYVDVTSVKTRAGEAKEAAKVLYSRMPKTEYVDTIVCMDGTEVIGMVVYFLRTAMRLHMWYHRRLTITIRCFSVITTKAQSQGNM